MKRHLDIYLYNSDMSTDYGNIYDQVHKNFQKILVDDENSSIRLNHVNILGNLIDHNFDSFFVSNQDSVQPTTFEKIQKKKNLTWVWILMSVLILLFLIAAGIALVLYRRRRSKIIHEIKRKRGNTVISQLESGNLDESRKDLFVDIKNLEIDFETIIGKGSTSTVYCGKLKGPAPIQKTSGSFETQKFVDCKVVIKIGNDFDQNSVEKFLAEIDAARKIGFEKNISCLLGWTFFREIPSLIFEPVDWNLLEWTRNYRKKKENFPEKIILKIFWQICSGMEKVASVGLIHRDLASRNILLTRTFEAKIADFGLCSTCDETFIYKAGLEKKLPIRWLSMEALTERVFSEFSDVWSFGILCHEVFSFGQIPYCNVEIGDLVDFLKSGKRLERLENIPENFWKIMESCWREERIERPTFSQLKGEIGIILETENENYGYLSYQDEALSKDITE
ncbi:hypothetical protein FO519_009123 [Halicephalobus sp. NKZ332]|nr:hypothetical protein FO519_009123 [Halicephalobus sp. NKZ332]